MYGTGGASASRVDGLFTEVFNSDGTSRLATASALTTLNTQVNGSGAISDKVDNIAASMFVDGDTDGTLQLATSAALDTVTAEVYSRWRHFYVSLGTAIKCDLEWWKPG